MITFPQLWQFYLTSRFIYPDKERQLAPYLAEISKTWDKLLDSSEDIFKLFVHERNSRIRSSIAVTRYYNKSWMVHHMASISDPRGMQKVLLKSIRWMMDNQLLDHGIFYWRPTNKRANDRFADLGKMLKGSKIEVTSENLLDYYFFPTQSSFYQQAFNLDIAAITPEESEAIIGLLSECVNPKEMDLRSLNTHHLELSNLDREYRIHGLTRKRNVFRATKDDHVVAVILWEKASMGLNFSHFFTTFQIYFVDTLLGTRDKVFVVGQIVGFLNACCLAKGENLLTCVCGPELSGCFKKLGFKPTKQYMCLSIARKLENSRTMGHFENFYSQRIKKL